jgi:outer membrane protein
LKITSKMAKQTNYLSNKFNKFVALLVFSLPLIFFGTKSVSANSFKGIVLAVNFERLLIDTDIAKQAQSLLQQEFGGRQEEIKSLATALVRDANNLDRQAPQLSQTELLGRQNDIRNRDLHLQGLNNKLNEDAARRNSEERERISQVIRGWLKKYSEKFNVAIIVPDAAYLNNKIDITENVIGLMNGTRTLESITYDGPKEISIAIVYTELIMQDSALSKSYLKSITERYGPNNSEEKNKQFQIARTEIVNKANPIVRTIAQKNNIDLILENAAYHKTDIDITRKIIEVLDGSDSYKVEFFPRATLIAFVDAEKIFSSFSNLNRQTVAEASNPAVKSFTQKKSIDLVVQRAAFVRPSFDITALVLPLINLSKDAHPNEKAGNIQKPPASKIDEAKKKCSELGFKSGTEGFGKCVLRLSE